MVRIEKSANFEFSDEELARFLEKSGDSEMSVPQFKGLIAGAMERGEFWTIGKAGECLGFFLALCRKRNTEDGSVLCKDFFLIPGVLLS